MGSSSCPGGWHCGPHSDRKREDEFKGQRETARVPTIPDMDPGGQDQGKHKLRRNCKNPAVAKRGLRGECSGSGGSMRETERRETV